MCESISNIGCLVWHIYGIRGVVHGAGLSPEDLDKPQVRRVYVVLSLLIDCPE